MKSFLKSLTLAVMLGIAVFGLGMADHGNAEAATKTITVRAKAVYSGGGTYSSSSTFTCPSAELKLANGQTFKGTASYPNGSLVSPLQSANCTVTFINVPIGQTGTITVSGRLAVGDEARLSKGSTSFSTCQGWNILCGAFNNGILDAPQISLR